MSTAALAWSLFAFSAASLVAIGGAFLVFFLSLTRKGSLDSFFATTASGLVASTILLFVNAIAAAFAVLVAGISNVFANGRYYLIGAFIGLTLVLLLPYSQPILRTVDTYATEIAIPVYQQVVLPLLNILRLVYQVVIPWWNLFSTLFRTFIAATISVLGECTEVVDARAVVQNILTFVLSIFNLLTGILAQVEQNDLAIQPIYSALANVTDPFTPWFNCFCIELSFAWNAVVYYIHTENFQYSGGPLGFTFILLPSHDLYNFVFNLLRSIIRFAAELIIAAFNPGPYDPFGCGPEDYTCVNTTSCGGDSNQFCGPFPIPFCNSYVECQVRRQPVFNLAFDYLCDFAYHWTGTLDDIILTFVRVFFANKQPDQVPRPFAVLAGIICGIGRFFQGLLDFFFKIDLVFSPIRYTTYINVTVQFDAFRDSPAKLITLFDSFYVAELHYIGCGLGNAIYAVIGVLDFLLNFVIALSTFNINFIERFLAIYDYESNIEQYAIQSVLCFQDALEMINHEWAQAVRYFLLCVVKVITIIVLTLSKIGYIFSSHPEDYLYYYVNHIVPQIFQLFDMMMRLGVALGNCIRTFDQFLGGAVGLAENCLQPLNDTYPVAYNLQLRVYGIPPPGGYLTEIRGIESHSNYFCVAGDGLQGISQFVFAVLQTIFEVVTSIINVIATPDVLQGVTVLRLLLDNLEIFVFYSILNIVETINGFLSGLGSFWACRDSSGSYIKQANETSVGSKLKWVFGNFTGILQFPFRSVFLSGEVIGLVVQCSLDSNSIPIFLQGSTGCTTDASKCGSVPKVDSCHVGITSIFLMMQSIICRFIFIFWDFVFTWFPKVMVALVEFIICLAEDTQDDLNFREFLQFLNLLRCLICTVVQIVLSILKSLVYLFQGEILYLIYAIVCLPPLSTLYEIYIVVFKLMIDFGGCLIDDLLGTSFSGACPTLPTGTLDAPRPQPLSWDNILDIAKYYATRDCHVRTDPRDPTNYSPLYPLCIISFLFKRSVDEPNTEFIQLPMDSSYILLSPDFMWGKEAEYNYSNPDSPCYSSYQYLNWTLDKSSLEPLPPLVQNTLVYFDTWLRSLATKYFTICVVSSNFANATNSGFSMMKKHPLPADFLINPVRTLNYTVGLIKHLWTAFEFIAARNSKSIIAETWQSFKDANGLTNDYPLALVSLFDESVHAASVALTLTSNYPEVIETMNPSNRKRSVDEMWVRSLSLSEEMLLWNDTRYINAKRSIPSGAVFSEEMFSNHIELGQVFGKAIYGTGKLVGFFDKMDTKMRSLYFNKKRSISPSEDMVKEQGIKNAHKIRAHAIVLLNFTRTVFDKVGSVMTRAYGNVFEYRRDDPTPSQARRSIRNLVMTVRSKMQVVFSGQEANMPKRSQIESQWHSSDLSKRITRPAFLVNANPAMTRDLLDSSSDHFQKRSSYTLELNDTAIETIDESLMIHVGNDFYTKRGTEMILYQKRGSTEGGVSIYYGVTYPPGGFVFAGQTFPLAQICFPETRVSLSPILSLIKPPPFFTIPLPGFCIECNLLLEYVNRLTYYLALAFNDTILTIRTIDPFVPYNPQDRTDFFFPPTIGAPTPAPTPYPAIFGSGQSWNDKLINLAWYPVWLITGVTVQEFKDAFVGFFSNADSSSSGSFLFWFEFLVSCDHATALRCGHGAYSGTGLTWGFLWTYGSLIFISIILGWFGLSSLLTYLWVFSPLVWFAVSYFYSPICFPALPDCLGNDIYYTFYSINANCLDWTPLYGDAISSQCPLDVTQCYFSYNLTYLPAPSSGVCPDGGVLLDPYVRMFPNCSDPKYGSGDPLYTIFYAIGWVWPAFNTWLLNTNSPTFRYLRTVEGVEDALNAVPLFQNGSPPPDYTTCFYLNASNAVGTLFWWALIGIFLAILLYFLIQILLAFINMIIASLTLTVFSTTEFVLTNTAPGADSGDALTLSSSQPPSEVAAAAPFRRRQTVSTRTSRILNQLQLF